MVDRGGDLSLSRQCELLGVSRSSQYCEPLGESAANLALMRRLDELHLEHPFYGSRQMTRHLRRERVVACRHRVRRLMRLMGMEAVYRRPRTSAANPEHRVYPYLLRDLAIDRPDQVCRTSTDASDSDQDRPASREDLRLTVASILDRLDSQGRHLLAMRWPQRPRVRSSRAPCPKRPITCRFESSPDTWC